MTGHFDIMAVAFGAEGARPIQVAVSDFDGTMYTRRKLIGEIVPDIAAWRAAGNQFGIATGRGYQKMMRYVRRQGVPFD